MSNWIKYDYVCTNCDALIEVTVLDQPAVDPGCVCNNSMIIGVGHAPAFAPIVREVTAPQVVKINSNPYN